MRTLRPAQETDHPLIYASWLKSQYYGNSWFKQIGRDIFFNGYKQVIAGRLATAKTVVVCLEADPDVVLGYACYSPDETTLHYVYVKKAWRQFGIAKELLPPTITTVSSLTKIGRMLKERKGLTFDPFQ
jgi:L-amino acid N-acyltransferase YncA